jgi:hypothetical protein
MKICNKCGLEKPLDRFNKRSGSKDGLQARCKQCNSEALKAHYNDNKAYYKDKQLKLRERNRDYIASIKSSSCCKICQEPDSCCLDFHHLTDKKYNVAEMPALGLSLELIQEEIDKCVVLCSNCHKKLHAGKINIGL